jgi:tetratricopeptide (TPR) repeat protein
MALVSAAFVAGRGPVAAVGGVGTLEPTRWRAVGLTPPSRPRLITAAGALLTALLCAWAVWQPERSDRLGSRALDQIETRDLGQAARNAAKAGDVDPLSPRPLLVRATVESVAGKDRAALATLERAVLRFPGDPQTWLRLASFDLLRLDRPRQTLEALRGALYLDPKSKAARRLFLAARARLRAQLATARPPPGGPQPAPRGRKPAIP